ncbi:MAG TPA: VIT1/CCC1 transporter family protein [Mycobacteriales bacterium]|nr:VIT1/CCC1 transporter family protein [Mycobacteriales bacterium]
MTETAAVGGTSTSPEIHHTHRDVSGGRLRPIVFGAMDGVISNSALIAGIAAAGASAHAVILTGVVGLLSGSFSMAVGEYTSVRSQTELVQAEIAKERFEITRSPQAEEAELAAIFRHRGLPRELATRVAHEVSKDPDEVWRVHVREELGVDPDEQPSPYVAAIASLITFCAGALVPLVPYLLGANRVVWSLVFGAVALVLLGVAVARFTGLGARSQVRGAVRQLVLGGAAFAVAFGVGAAMGVGSSG